MLFGTMVDGALINTKINIAYLESQPNKHTQMYWHPYLTVELLSVPHHSDDTCFVPGMK